MERVHVEFVRDYITDILSKKKILSARQLSEELKTYFSENGVPWAKSEEDAQRFINSIKRVSLYVVLSTLEKDGLIKSVPARSAPIISTYCYWKFSKKEKVWMLADDYYKYLENPKEWVDKNKSIIMENCS